VITSGLSSRAPQTFLSILSDGDLIALLLQKGGRQIPNHRVIVDPQYGARRDSAIERGEPA